MMRKESTGFWLLILLTALWAISGCGDQKIRLGFVGPLSGKMSDLGTQGRNGALLAIDTINELGGVNGKQLELIEMDNEGDKNAARRVVKRLCEEKVSAVIGPMTSSIAMALLPMMSDCGIPFVSPTVSTPHLSGSKDLFFRVQPENTNWADGLVLYLLNQSNIKTLALAEDVDNADYTFTANDAVAKRFIGAGGHILARVQFSGNDRNSFDVIKKALKATRPEGLVIAASARDVAALAKMIRPDFPDLVLITPAWGSTIELVGLGGKAVEGLLSVVSYAEDSQYADFIEFKRRYKERFGIAPNFAAARAYDAVLLITSALKKADGDPELLVRHLAPTLKVPGVAGPFTVNEYGDVKRQVYVQKIENGRLKTVELR